MVLPAWAGALLACSGGHAHSVAVTRSGLLFEFGGGDFWWLHDSNDFALLGGAEGGDEGWGDPQRDRAEVWGGHRQAWVPKPIKVGDKERVARASAGHDFTTVLTRSGAVYCLAAGAAGGESVRVRGALAAAPRRLCTLASTLALMPCTHTHTCPPTQNAHTHADLRMRAHAGVVGKQGLSEARGICSGYGQAYVLFDDDRVFTWAVRPARSGGSGAWGGGVEVGLPTPLVSPNQIHPISWVASGCEADHCLVAHEPRLNQQVRFQGIGTGYVVPVYHVMHCA